MATIYIFQHWRDESADLGQFADPEMARQEVATKFREEREETRLGEVERQMVDQFQLSYT